MGPAKQRNLDCKHDRTERTINSGIVRIVCLDCDAVEIEHAGQAVTEVKVKQRRKELED